MKLDRDEKLIYKLAPDKKILVPWFFTKTIGALFTSLFFVSSILFVLNTIDVLNRDKPSNVADVELAKSNNMEQKNSTEKELEHPFQLMLKYWEWALFISLIITLCAQLYYIYLRKSYTYIITNKRCIFVGGILKRTERSVSYKKVTDVQRSQNILERILGIWNVQIFTPGTGSVAIGLGQQAKAEINFDGLTNSEESMEAINKYIQECN